MGYIRKYTVEVIRSYRFWISAILVVFFCSLAGASVASGIISILPSFGNHDFFNSQEILVIYP